MYTATIGETIYVLHTFQKKSTQGIATPQRELDLIKRRLQIAKDHESRKGTSR
jgi:phage-related protein